MNMDHVKEAPNVDSVTTYFWMMQKFTKYKLMY